MFHRLTPTANRVLMALAVLSFACWSFAAAAILTWEPGRAVALRAVARIVEQISPPRRAIHAHPQVAALSAVRVAGAGHSGTIYSTDDADPDFSWALLESDGTMFSDSHDGRRFPVEGRKDEPTFWFRDGVDEYTVTDPAIVAEARRATAPVRELGREMGLLGAEMGRHGARMGRLGGRMGALGARIAILESRQALRQASRSARAETKASTHQLHAELQRLQSQLSTEQGRHAGRQRELSRRMSTLSARHQVAYRKAKAEVREIARKAQRQGKAGRPHANA